MNEHTSYTGNNLLVRIGVRHNRVYLVLPDYKGPWQIGSELMKAIEHAAKEKKLIGSTPETLDHIEILQWV